MNSSMKMALEIWEALQRRRHCWPTSKSSICNEDDTMLMHYYQMSKCFDDPKRFNSLDSL